MYQILKYSVLVCDLLLTILLLIGNNVKDISDPREVKRTINATWIMVWILVLNSALLLAKEV